MYLHKFARQKATMRCIKEAGLVFTFKIDEDDWAIDLAGFGTSRDVAVNVTPVEVSA